MYHFCSQVQKTLILVFRLRAVVNVLQEPHHPEIWSKVPFAGLNLFLRPLYGSLATLVTFFFAPFKGREGCNCDENKNVLNRKTPEEVRAELPTWVSTLVESASKFHVPEIISRAVAQKWLVESIQEAEECISSYHQQMLTRVDAMRDMRSRKPL